MRWLAVGLLMALGTAGCSSAAQPPTRERAHSSALETVELDGLTLEIEPAAHLFGPHYERYRLDGDSLVPVADPFDRGCYFDGRVVGAADSRVAVRSCRSDRADITGVVVVDGVPSRLVDGVFGPMSAPHGRCGVAGGHQATITPTAPTPGLRTRRAALESIQPRFIEVLAVQDSALLDTRDQGYDVGDVALTVHMAAALYDGATFDDRVLPLLTAVIDTGGSDPWGAPPSSGGEALSGPYLDNFNAWLNSSSSLPDYDEATLFTGWDLDGLTVGLANVEGACDHEIAGALVSGVGSDDSVAQTLAHEIGHTIGMSHDGDGNSCPQSGYIMTWIYEAEGPYPTQFSSCSTTDANAWLGSGAAWCIDREAQEAFDAPNCGDGKVDAGEQCDCGPNGCAGRDPCCDGATCRLRVGATCSVADGCCDEATCSPVAQADNIVCRPAGTPCDIEEVCDGSARCPVDQYEPTGTSCSEDGWDGACMTGVCVTRGGICEAISDDYIFDTPPYDPICADAGCDVMECISDGACVYTEYGTPDGTPCGNGQQCWQGRCVASSTLPGGDGCSQPQLDSDDDGTRDCDDECPYDATTAVAPCETVDPDSTSDGADMGGNGGPDAGGSASERDPEINLLDSTEEGGCATAGGEPSIPFVLMALLFGFRQR